jgi:AGCS family alanine or glycine:cation symporter
MALPNLIAVTALSGVVVAETKVYMDGLKKDKIQP